MADLFPPDHPGPGNGTSEHRYPKSVVLLCTDSTVYLSRGFELWALELPHLTARRLAAFPVAWVWRQAAKFRHLRRLGRLDIRELLELPDGSLLAVVQKAIVRLTPGRDCPQQVFKVSKGGRPKGFALTPNGHIFVGEYWGNPRRRPLHLRGSTDNGATWQVVHELRAGSAQHIHNLVWDSHRRGLWVLTGDADGECSLLFSRDEFQTVSEVMRGGQLFRACHLFCQPEGIYYGTDSERAQNWFVFFDPASGALKKIQELPGSTINAAGMGGRFFLSTSVEPSKVNYCRHTILFSSRDLQKWVPVVKFQKDCWPGRYFGFGSVVLPRVQGQCEPLVFSAVAVKENDYCSFVIPADRVSHLIPASESDVTAR